jgi:sporulation protein YlmC with PRC-barrel domain
MMRNLAWTGMAALVATTVAAANGAAACTDELTAFEERYQRILAESSGADALTPEEMLDLVSLKRTAEQFSQAGEPELCESVVDRANAMLSSAITPQVVTAAEFKDIPLTNAAGDDLGEIEDILIDPNSGRIAYVVVHHGGFLGMGEDVFAIPYEAARAVPGQEKMVVDITEEQLRGAPKFNRSDRSPLGQRAWAQSVHSYYDVQPYWHQPVIAVGLTDGSGATREQPQQEAQQGQESQGSESRMPSDDSRQSASPNETQATETQATETQASKHRGAAAGAATTSQFAATSQEPSPQTGIAEDVRQLEQKVETLETKTDRLSGKVDAMETRLDSMTDVVAPTNSGGHPSRDQQGAAGDQSSRQGAPDQGTRVTDDKPTDAQRSSTDSAPAGEQPEAGSTSATSMTATTKESASNESASKSCGDQAADLERRIETRETAGNDATGLDDARDQLRIARAMASMNADESCLSALERARQSLGLETSDSGQRSN